MPRDGSGQYSLPLGVEGVPDTTIESAKYNTFIADVEQDMNLPRPVVAGGTGATSAAGARTNLQAEVAAQVVANFDTHVFETGSFVAAQSLPGAPVAGEPFVGAAVLATANDIVVTAIGRTNGKTYQRRKTSGSWGAWVNETASDKVAKAGDTMTGDLVLTRAGTPTIGFLGLGSGGKNLHFDGSQYQMPGANLNLGATFGVTWGAATYIQEFSGSIMVGVGGANRLLFQTGAMVPAVTGGYNLGSAGNQYGGLFLSSGTAIDWSNGASKLTHRKALGPGTYELAYEATAIVNNVAIKSAHISGTGGHMLAFIDGQGTLCGAIISDATANTTGYGTSSDRRIKTDPRPLRDALDLIEQFKIYNHGYVKDKSHRGIGLFAQEAHAIGVPGLVMPGDDNAKKRPGDEGFQMWSVDYARAVPVLIAAVQELLRRVEELEA